MLADFTGAFGFIAKGLYFISTSHVFGSNTSASSWEAFQWAIHNLIPTLAQRTNLVKKYKELLDKLQWVKEDNFPPELVKVFPCEINRGILDSNGDLLPMTVNIYVDDILAAAAFWSNTLKLLAAIIEAIFMVCGFPDISIHQCPLSLEKWLELKVGTIQTVLGLIVDTNRMAVGITDKYIERVRDLLKLWDPDQRFFKVNDMQSWSGNFPS